MAGLPAMKTHLVQFGKRKNKEIFFKVITIKRQGRGAGMITKSMSTARGNCGDLSWIQSILDKQNIWINETNWTNLVGSP